MNRKDYYISENLVEALNRTNLNEVAQVVDEAMHKLDAQLLVDKIYPCIDELPSDLINALAIQLHVDFYDTELDLETRRALVKGSIPWHRRKGTKWAVEQVVSTVYNSAKVSEWFEYGGEPYHFRVSTISPKVINPKITEKVIQSINTVKNTRSWLDGIDYQRDIKKTVYMGGAVSAYRDVFVHPSYVKDSTVGCAAYAGATVTQHGEVYVGPSLVRDSILRNASVAGAAVTAYKEVLVHGNME